jgi:hypothetical protein
MAAAAAPHSRLRASAEAVLLANDEGSYTVPSRLTYPHQWNWDSALSVGLSAQFPPQRGVVRDDRHNRQEFLALTTRTSHDQ